MDIKIIEEFEFLLDRNYVFKAIDCHEDSPVYDEIIETYEDLEERMKLIVQPKAIFAFIEKTDTFPMEEVNDCKYILYCLLTLGENVTNESGYYFDSGLYLEGMIFDAMADSLLEEFSHQLYKAICVEAKKHKLGLTSRLSPGNLNFPLSYQPHVVEKLKAKELLDIDTTEGFMLKPLKSTSFIFGADATLGIPIEYNECLSCTSITCKMRKESGKDCRVNEIVNLKVIVKGKEVNIKADKHTSIMDILIENKIKINSLCAGKGKCGKCKVHIIEGKVRKLEKNNDDDWCLACSSFLETDVAIIIDNYEHEFSIQEVFKFKSQDVNTNYKLKKINIVVKDIMGRSLTEFINSKLGKSFFYSLVSLKKLSTLINSYEVEENNPITYDRDEIYLLIKNNEVIDIVESTSKIYGIGIDIGTTTLALTLVNLITGEVLKSCSLLNSQSQYGSDIISRIQSSNEGKFKELTRCIREDLKKGIRELLSINQVKSEVVHELCIAGNTTMLYFLLGLPCESLAFYPFNTVTTSKLNLNYKEVFIDEFLSCRVTILPAVSAYVGADIVSGLINCSFENMDKTCLFIDIGTNGEMAIGNKEKIFCLATAAGPAFEGANISCGIGSINGAISCVKIVGDGVKYKTIGNSMPIGICGSAVIDICAALVENHIIDETGRFDEELYKDATIEIARNSVGESINFNQKDIREVQLAKSAIRSGIEILLKQSNVSIKEIERVFIAGGFGTHINIHNASIIGLLPMGIQEKVVAIGNSSLGGSVDYLINRDKEKAIEHILSKTKYIDISSYKEFNDLFINNMMF